VICHTFVTPQNSRVKWDLSFFDNVMIQMLTMQNKKRNRRKLILELGILLVCVNMIIPQHSYPGEIDLQQLSLIAYAGEESGETGNTDPIYKPFSIGGWFGEFLDTIGLLEE